MNRSVIAVSVALALGCGGGGARGDGGAATDPGPGPADPGTRADAQAGVEVPGSPDAIDPGTDAPGADVASLPPGCCQVDADCDKGNICVLDIYAMESGEPGLCLPPIPATPSHPSACWTVADCASDEECHGAAVCPCGMDCDMDYEGPGVCVRKAGACKAVDPAWVQEWCDAASVVVFDGQKCVGTCPGCCECKPFCDLVFHDLAACETACLPFSR